MCILTPLNLPVIWHTFTHTISTYPPALFEEAGILTGGVPLLTLTDTYWHLLTWKDTISTYLSRVPCLRRLGYWQEESPHSGVSLNRAVTGWDMGHEGPGQERTNSARDTHVVATPTKSLVVADRLILAQQGPLSPWSIGQIWKV